MLCYVWLHQLPLHAGIPAVNECNADIYGDSAAIYGGGAHVYGGGGAGAGLGGGGGVVLNVLLSVCLDGAVRIFREGVEGDE
eukprot:590154-Rhodomonas_salina.3